MEDSDAICFHSDAEVTVRENPALEQAEQNANTVATSNDTVTIYTDSIADRGNMSATPLEELLSTLMQTIQSEICKQPAALEAKLTAESSKQSAESGKQTATMDSKLTSTIQNLKSELRYENEKLPESLIARFESANASIPEYFIEKLGSEIRVVSDKIDNASRDATNKIDTLNNAN